METVAYNSLLPFSQHTKQWTLHILGIAMAAEEDWCVVVTATQTNLDPSNQC